MDQEEIEIAEIDCLIFLRPDGAEEVWVWNPPEDGEEAGTMQLLSVNYATH